jgi:serine/threonine protein kinase
MSELGKGGMGVVYSALDEHLDRPVALKVLIPEFASQENSLERLRMEARAAARLSHPHIVSVYSFGQEGRTPYIAMELVEGNDLSQEIKRNGKLPTERAIDIARQAAEALEYAARNNVIHRDIKPSNIFLTREGNVKVMDFGLAKRIDADPQLTSSGFVVGTPAYMAPEQAMGKKVDFRADIYSLGCTLYAMLAGAPPFQADTPFSVMMMHVQEEIPIPEEWRKIKKGRLAAVLQRMTEKKLEERYQSWEDVTRDLLALEVSPDTITVPKLRRKPAGSRKWLWIAAPAVLLLLVVGSFAFTRMNGRPTRAAIPPQIEVPQTDTVKNAAPADTAPAPKPTPVLDQPDEPMVRPDLQARADHLAERLIVLSEKREEISDLARNARFTEAAEMIEKGIAANPNPGQAESRVQQEAGFAAQVFRMAAELDQQMLRIANRPNPTREERIQLARQYIAAKSQSGEGTEVMKGLLYLVAMNEEAPPSALAKLRTAAPQALSPENNRYFHAVGFFHADGRMRPGPGIGPR